MTVRLAVAAMARRKRLNMAQVADALDVDHQTVLYWNQGRSNPRLPMLLKLCQFLECTVEELCRD